MASPISERGAFFEGSQFGGDYTTPGFTVSVEVVNIIPADVSVHVGLARVAAAEAIIGVAGFTSVGQGAVSFGIPETWETAAYVSKLSALTIGFSVARGVAKGWWFMQVWG